MFLLGRWGDRPGWEPSIALGGNHCLSEQSVRLVVYTTAVLGLLMHREDASGGYPGRIVLGLALSGSAVFGCAQDNPFGCALGTMPPLPR